MRVKPFIARVADAEGTTGEYVFRARTRRRAKRDVREWCTRTDWGATIVSVKRARVPGKRAKRRTEWGGTIVWMDPSGVPGQRATGHRLLRVAGVTFAVSGVTIATLMIVGLTLDGAL
jgi:hypothetical protein